MKKKNVKRIITGTLMAVCVGVMTAGVAVPVMYDNVLAADDLEGPVIKSFKLDKTEAGPGDVIKVTAEAEDESGVTRCFVYFTKDGRDVSFYLYPNDDGILEGEITVDSNWSNGTYVLFALSPSDTIGNTSNYYSNSSNDFNEGFDTQFTVKGANSDNKGPVIKTFKLDKTEARPGDVIKVTAEAEDESGVTRCFVYFTKDGRDVSFYLYPNDDGILEGEITVDSNWSNGTYVLFALSPSDTIGNTSNYYSNSSNDFNEGFDTQFTVKGANSDNKGPVIKTFKLDKTEARPGDVIKVTAEAEDESGVTRCFVYFTKDGRDVSFYLYPNDDGILEGEIVVDSNWSNGTYVLFALSPSDTIGNTSNYYSNSSNDFNEDFDTQFIVNGKNDKSAPVITSLSTDKQEYDSWDTIYATATATDETHNDHLTAVFESEAGDTIEITLNENGQEELSGNTSIYGGKPDGKYTLRSVTAYDVVGNSKQYTPDNLKILKDIYFYVGESHKYKQLNIKTTESQTVRVPYYGDSYSMTSAGNSVSVYNSDPSHVSVALTGINMSSAGSYITYRITGRSEGNSIVKFTDAYSGELLDAYNVNVGPAVRETVKACKGANVTFTVTHFTEGIHARIDLSASAMPVNVSTSSSSINGSYYAESKLTYTFGNTGTFEVDVYDSDDVLLKSYSVNVTDHNWGSWSVAKEATYTEEGKKQRVCKNDPAHIDEQSIPKLEGFITLDKKTLIVDKGKSGKINVLFTPEDFGDKTITWSSSNTGVAKVDASGNVTAVNHGTAKITAKTSNGKTAECEVRVNADTFTGVKMDAGQLKRFRSGAVDTAYTGVDKYPEDGKWYYFEKGIHNPGFTGIAKSSKGNWIFVKDGVYDAAFTGIAKSTKGNWLYAKNGRYDTSYTGVAKSTKGNWLYVTGGRWDTKFTGAAKATDGRWLYVKDGRHDSTFTGAARSTKGNWIYVNKGVYTTGYSGVTKATDGKWLYMKNGRHEPGFTGVAKSDKGNWIYVKNGVYDTSFTGVAKSTKGNWIYVKNGRYDASFTGIAQSTKGNKLYIVKGRWQNTYTGKYQHYNIKNGYVI